MNQSEILEEVGEIVDDKNDDYGSSWEKVSVLKRVIADEDGPQTITLSRDDVLCEVAGGEDKGDKIVRLIVDEDFFKETNEVEFVQLADTPERNTLFKEQVDDLFTRLLDKVVRGYYTTLVKAETLVDDESKIDAFKDLVGYAALGGSLVSEEE
jgi:hypothetical protein